MQCWLGLVAAARQMLPGGREEIPTLTLSLLPFTNRSLSGVRQHPEKSRFLCIPQCLFLLARELTA